MSKDCVKRNHDEYKKHGGIFGTNTEFRINTLRKFINKEEPSIDIGCGAYTPKYLGTTHACDNGQNALKYLRNEGWKGKFKVSSVADLKYKDKQFKVAVCSEVIEHLKTEKQVAKAFEEINRVSERWLITTPAIIINDPDHKFFFTGDHLFDIIPFSREDYIIIRKSIYFYISNDIPRLSKLLEVKT